MTSPILCLMPISDPAEKSPSQSSGACVFWGTLGSTEEGARGKRKKQVYLPDLQSSLLCLFSFAVMPPCPITIIDVHRSLICLSTHLLLTHQSTNGASTGASGSPNEQSAQYEWNWKRGHVRSQDVPSNCLYNTLNLLSCPQSFSTQFLQHTPGDTQIWALPSPSAPPESLDGEWRVKE